MQAVPWKLRIRLCCSCLGCLDEFRSSCLCPFLLHNLCEEKVRQTKITNDSDTSASPRTALHSFRQLRSRCDLWLSSLRRWPGLSAHTSRRREQRRCPSNSQRSLRHYNAILALSSTCHNAILHSRALASHWLRCQLSGGILRNWMEFFGANLDIGAKACVAFQ